MSLILYSQKVSEGSCFALSKEGENIMFWRKQKTLRQQCIDEITHSAYKQGIELKFKRLFVFRNYVVNNLKKVKEQGKAYKLRILVADSKYLTHDRSIWHIVGTTPNQEYEKIKNKLYEEALDSWRRWRKRDGAPDPFCSACGGTGEIYMGEWLFNRCSCTDPVGPEPAQADHEPSGVPKRLKVYASIEVD
jgi:hypothetical protein